MAIDIARERRLLEFDKYGKIKKKQSNGSDIEEVLGLIIEEKISISGGYKKESLKDTLLVWIIVSPVTLYNQAIWWSKWIHKYWIKNEEYDEEAKVYLICKNLKVSEEQFHVSRQHSLLIQQLLVNGERGSRRIFCQ
jgi:DnaJ family protein C protein 25